MKKLIAMLLALCMVMAFAACGTDTNDKSAGNSNDTTTTGGNTNNDVTDPSGEDDTTDPTDGEVTVMTYDQFMAAEIDAPVRIETYVQATQSWWDNKITVYCQDPDGAYFLYELACMEEDAASLVPGAKIRVTGYKAEWAGEIEIVDATFELIEGDSYIAKALNVTALLGTDELIDHQNEYVFFQGMTVEDIEYKNDEPGDDIYVTVSDGEQSYNFCVEVYLTGPDTEVYQTVGTLSAGDVVDITGFLYWYEDVNTHITGISLSE